MFSSLTENAAKGTAALAKGDIEKGAKKIRKKAEKVIDEVEDNIEEFDENVFTDLSDTANKVGVQVRSIFDTASSDAKGGFKRLESEIKANPVRSSVIALGVGVVLGALLRRK